MSGADVLVLAIVAAVVVLAVVSLVRAKKKGKTCCGDCSQCGRRC